MALGWLEPEEMVFLALGVECKESCPEIAGHLVLS